MSNRLQPWRDRLLHRSQSCDCNVEAECRPLARLACDGNLAPHEFHKALADRKAQSRSAEPARGRGIDLTERFEKTIKTIRRDANAGVADSKLKVDPVSGRAIRCHRKDDFALFCEFDCIVQKVEQDLTQPSGVGANALRDGPVEDIGDIDLLFCGTEGDQFKGAFDAVTQLYLGDVQIELGLQQRDRIVSGCFRPASVELVDDNGMCVVRPVFS